YSNLTTLNLELTPNLEILNLEHCADLEELYIPNGCPKLQYLNLGFSKLRNLRLGPTLDLETLSLGRCNLAEPHMPSECPKLKFISFHNSNLRKLNLETLCLGGCCNLILLHMPFKCLKLNSLSLANSKLRTLDLGLTPNSERLDLKDCSNLVDINAPDGCLKKLVYLDLTECGTFKSLLFDKQSKPLKVGFLSELHLIGESIDICPLHPDNSFPKFQFTCSYKEDPAASSFGNLKKLISIELQMPDESLNLECLTLSHLKLKTIQLRNTPNLKELILIDCNYLVEFQMPAESLNLQHLNLRRHSKLRTLNLGCTPKLRWLNLENCCDLVEINAPNGFLFSVVLLILSGCGRFKVFWFDKQLKLNHSKKQLTDSLSELHLIAETIDVCQVHPDNSFPKFQFECYYDEAPASSFGNLEMLISMGLCACTNLEKFSRSICSLRGIVDSFHVVRPCTQSRY
nr:hypothetical protein [Tanacetum cinerariifolium]